MLKIFRQEDGGKFRRMISDTKRSLKEECGPRPLLKGSKRDDWNRCMDEQTGGVDYNKLFSEGEKEIEKKCGKRPLFRGKKRDEYNKCADELVDAAKKPVEPEGNEVANTAPAKPADEGTINIGESLSSDPPQESKNKETVKIILLAVAGIWLIKKIFF